MKCPWDRSKAAWWPAATSHQWRGLKFKLWIKQIHSKYSHKIHWEVIFGLPCFYCVFITITTLTYIEVRRQNYDSIDWMPYRLAILQIFTSLTAPAQVVVGTRKTTMCFSGYRSTRPQNAPSRLWSNERRNHQHGNYTKHHTAQQKTPPVMLATGPVTGSSSAGSETRPRMPRRNPNPSHNFIFKLEEEEGQMKQEFWEETLLLMKSWYMPD